MGLGYQIGLASIPGQRTSSQRTVKKKKQNKKELRFIIIATTTTKKVFSAPWLFFKFKENVLNVKTERAEPLAPMS